MFKKIASRSILLIGSILLVGITTTTSYAGNILGNSDKHLSSVLFMATLNNTLAMREIDWTLYKLENDTFVKINTFKQHTSSLKLPPGIYRAEATLDGITRTRVIDTRNTKSNSVIIAMD